MIALGTEVSGFIGVLIIQFIFMIIYAIFVRYDFALLPDATNATKAEQISISAERKLSYPHFQDIHVMIFIGFAYLMTFLKKYCYSATGFNLLIAALIIEWAILIRGFFHLSEGYIRISLDSMIGADVSAAVLLISMGALLGRTTPIQLLLMGLIEITVFAANEYFQLEILKISDAGGSIVVHAFGAYFGLAVSFMMRPKNIDTDDESLEGASYSSDIFAMIGTLFLWIFWPSFNSALLTDLAQQHRAILNTYLCLASATVTTFVVSAVVSPRNKLDMVHIQNSTLAGGVAIGSVCNMLIGPHIALLIGFIAAIISVLGYHFVLPIMRTKLRLYDTCGVHNLHGMPAILSAIFSAIYATVATIETYEDSLMDIFPAMNWQNSSFAMEYNGPSIAGGFGRTAAQQGGYQLLGIASTICFAVISGIFSGLFLNSSAMRRLDKDELHNDEAYWEIADSEKNV